MNRRYTNYLANLLLALTLASWPLLDAVADTFVVYGASGNIGGAIVEEALSRGHDVIGVSRTPANLTNDHPGFSAVSGDVTDSDSIAETGSRRSAVCCARSELALRRYRIRKCAARDSDGAPAE